LTGAPLAPASMPTTVAGRHRPLHGGRDRIGIGGVEKNDVGAGRDEGVHCGYVLVQVVVVGDRRNLGVRIYLFDFRLDPFRQGDIERIAQGTDNDPNRV